MKTRFALMLALAAGLAFAAAPVTQQALADEKKDEHDHSGHDHDHGHDHAHESHHGGHAFIIGPYDGELLMGEGMVEVFVHDHDGNHIDLVGGDMIVLVDGGNKKLSLKKHDLGLMAEIDESMHGAKAVVRVKTPDGKTHAANAVLKNEED